MFYLANLQNGGYPFKADDLPLEVWSDLGVLRAKIDEKKQRL